MIICHEHRFIFVKTGKTAGTSIEVMLGPHCGEDAVMTPFFEAERGHEPRNFRGRFDPFTEALIKRRLGMSKAAFKQTALQFVGAERYFHHMPAWQIRLRNPREWAEYHTFCVERNPWDKVISGWQWMRRSRSLDIDIDDYLEGLRRHIEGRLPGVGTAPYNFPNYVDPATGRVIVDQILRYEDLGTSLGELLDVLGIPDVGPLPHAKQTVTRSPLTLTPRQVSTVGELFRAEISLHGYEPPVELLS